MMPTSMMTTDVITTTANGTNIISEKTGSHDIGFTQEAIIWVSCAIAFCVVIFALSTIMYIRRRSQSPKAKKKQKIKEDIKRKAKEEKHISDISRDPIPVTNFVDILRQKKKENLLQIEYKALHRLQDDYSCEDALLRENRSKNAYPEVLPDDNTRVLLEPIHGEPGSDYINATYVDGYKRHKLYIATQGPKAQTLNDFWRMVWQEGSHCIVMATNLFEHARQQCEKYWHNKIDVFGDVQVELVDTDVTADFTVRTFKLTMIDSKKERIIQQFQLNSWNEHDCPDASSVLEYRRRIKAFSRNKSGPIIVHCSNGAGRTGTFIAIDMLLDRLGMEDNLDVFNCVLSLRNTRAEMVANLQQYVYIYECISIYIRCGVTVIPARELPPVIQKLSMKDPHSRLTGFEKELKTFDSVVPKLMVGECAGGHRLENRRKSRDIMIQPPERARPYLITFDSSDSSDYINACYVDGYRRQNAYIVTQWPMKNTMNDIWRLVFDYHIATVVVLNDMSESRSCPRFWPEKHIGEWDRYGPINVSYRGTQTFPNVTSRTFHVKKCDPLISFKNTPEYSDVHHRYLALANPLGVLKKGKLEEESKVVQMFQLTCWPNNQKVPTDNHSLMELITMSEAWQEVAADRNSPICVVSKNGVSRVGPYCAVSYACEKLKAEGEVDIFHAVKVTKMNRPQLIENAVEYIYCYTFMVLMLDVILTQRQQLEAHNPPQIEIFVPADDSKRPISSNDNHVLKAGTGEENENSLADYKGFDHYSFIAQRMEEYKRTQRSATPHSHTNHVHYDIQDDCDGNAEKHYANNWEHKNGRATGIKDKPEGVNYERNFKDPYSYKATNKKHDQNEDIADDKYAVGRKFDHYDHILKDARRDSYASYTSAIASKHNSIVDQRRISFVGSYAGTEGYYSCDSRRSSYASAFDSNDHLNEIHGQKFINSHTRSSYASGYGNDPSRLSYAAAMDSRRSSYASYATAIDSKRSSFADPRRASYVSSSKADQRRASYASTHYLFDYYHEDSPYYSNNYVQRGNDIYHDPILQSKVQNYTNYAKLENAGGTRI